MPKPLSRLHVYEHLLHGRTTVNRLPRDHGNGSGGLFETSPVFSLAYRPGIEHFRSDDGREWIGYDPSLPYPLPPYSGHQPYERSVRDVLLHPDEHMLGHGPSVGQKYLKLPENYISMGQALNDAIGRNASPHSLAISRKAFGEVGSALKDLAEGAGVLPAGLSYKQIILLRDGGGIKLLPPVELEPVSQELVRALSMELIQSCVEAASTEQQVTDLYGALQGFIDTFGDRWE